MPDKMPGEFLHSGWRPPDVAKSIGSSMQAALARVRADAAGLNDSRVFATLSWVLKKGYGPGQGCRNRMLAERSELMLEQQLERSFYFSYDA
jgi:hypothetical protein